MRPKHFRRRFMFPICIFRACPHSPKCSDFESDFSQNEAIFRSNTVCISRKINEVMRKISRKTSVERICGQVLRWDLSVGGLMAASFLSEILSLSGLPPPRRIYPPALSRPSLCASGDEVSSATCDWLSYRPQARLPKKFPRRWKTRFSGARRYESFRRCLFRVFAGHRKTSHA